MIHSVDKWEELLKFANPDGKLTETDIELILDMRDLEAMASPNAKAFQDAFLEGFEYAEDVGKTTTDKVVAEAMRRYPEKKA